ncbi:MAG: PDZ domain-containing protein [Phycisphaerales bacterium]|nr:PDZ domain-containing protein [Phycisphaerales bacterium]
MQGTTFPTWPIAWVLAMALPPAWAGQTAPQSSPDPAAPSEDRLTESPEPSAELAARIDAWILELASPTHQVRDAASDSLTEHGAHALRQLRQAYVASRDLEVRLRIETIVREAFFNERLYSKNAFLGISMEPMQVTHAMDPRVPQGGEGIVIGGIVPGTSAEQADLRARDIIIMLDGEPVHANRSVGDPGSFSEVLRLKGVGADITLTVIRRDALTEVPVTLGARPREYYRSMEAPNFAEQKNRIEGDFRTWWRKWFAPDAAKQGFKAKADATGK